MQIELMHVKVVPGRPAHGESTPNTVWGESVLKALLVWAD
jgi:hypothetical protein